ncbi:MAG TPA: cysteine hydrolase [candidate division Zixibacteria bacterium]|nr:cysteine hydrolase [candidate division Zixibacteria bacterium]
MKPYANAETIEEKCREWLDRVRPFNRSELRVEPSKAVLMVIDMQNFFLDESSPTFTEGGTAIVPNVRRLIETFRSTGRPVIFTRHVHHPDDIDIGIMGWWWDGKCVEGSPESEIYRELAPLPNEKIISKHRYSAFYNTDLETVLRCMKIEDIVITGVMTNLCCESTARDAYFRDYRVFFPADATGAAREEFHVASLMNLAYGFASITTTEKIIGELTA